VREPKAVVATVGLGAIGAGLLVWALVAALPEVLPWTVICGGAAYGISLVGKGVDGGAPLVAVGLLLVVELATWSIDERLPIKAEPAVARTRALGLGLLALGSLLVGGLLVALSGLGTGGGLVWTALGAAAAVAVVGLATRRRA
jgi:hypothetical protein